MHYSELTLKTTLNVNVAPMFVGAFLLLWQTDTSSTHLIIIRYHHMTCCNTNC